MAARPRPSAHTLVTPYDLPIPFSAYVFACAATLVLTFAVLAFVPNAATRGTVPAAPSGSAGAAAIGRLGRSRLLALPSSPGCAAREPDRQYRTDAVLGGPDAGPDAADGAARRFLSDHQPLARLLRLLHIGAHPPRRYPAWLACWPAFLCYLALAWLELMAPPLPSLLAWSLLAYGGLTAAGAALFGRAAWFRHAELFSVFFRMVGKLRADRLREPDGRRWHATLRPVLAGTLADAPHHVSLLLFVLFMLAATTYDGVWQTSFWAGLYWGNLWRGCTRSGATTSRAPRRCSHPAMSGISAAACCWRRSSTARSTSPRWRSSIASPVASVPVGALACRFAFTLDPDRGRLHARA